MKTAVVYALGALLAIVANLVLQDFVLGPMPAADWGIFPSVLAGTAGGLVVKYFWDRALIFDYRPESAARNARTFLAYSLTGVVTTGVFWAFEFGFDAMFGTKSMRYTGAVVGLTAGYLLKYRLDRRYVFHMPQKE